MNNGLLKCCPFKRVMLMEDQVVEEELLVVVEESFETWLWQN